jgi:hypothetical protein
MDMGEMIALVSILLSAGILATGFVGAWLLGRARGEALAAGRTATSGDSDARLLRIERMIEGLGVEVERIAESQRFMARRLGPGVEEPK